MLYVLELDELGTIHVRRNALMDVILQCLVLHTYFSLHLFSGCKIKSNNFL